MHMQISFKVQFEYDIVTQPYINILLVLAETRQTNVGINSMQIILILNLLSLSYLKFLKYLQFKRQFKRIIIFVTIRKTS